VVKATGAGLYTDLNSFAVTLDPALPPRLIRIDGQSPGAWRLHDFSPRPDLAGAIACMTDGRDILVTRRS
jgi:phosphopantetheinyl transferase